MKIIAEEDGMCEKAAERLFDNIAEFAGYGFNKSHAAAYTLISYQAMWLRVNYPLEFFAAAMSEMGDDKIQGLMREAKANGVKVIYPDINRSSDRFEIDRGWSAIVVPFQKIKGLSTTAANAIAEARAAGPFTSKADFIARVEKRKCNSRVQDALDKVGAFASIEPSQPSANDPCRIKDQTELMPNLVSDYVPTSHQMHTDKVTRQAIVDLADEYRIAHGPGSGAAVGLPVKPHFGRTARIMVVLDAPSADDEGNGVIGFGRTNDALYQALDSAGLTMQDVYMTALIKRAKSGKQVTADEITLWKPYFERELGIMKPDVVVMLGSQVVRTFVPTFKGKASDVAGEVLYFRDMDANVVFGFSQGEIYYAPEKQEALDKVFSVAKELMN